MIEFLKDFIKIVLPASLVVYGMYLVVKSFLHKEFEKKLVEIKIKNNEIVLPIRLQAYERMCLFLERITPHNLVVRCNEQGMNVAQLQQQMLFEIREEYNHNMSQQVYMSDEAWNQVKKSMDSIVVIINNSANGLSSENRSIELAKNIFDRLMGFPEDPTASALKFLKNEIRQVM